MFADAARTVIRRCRSLATYSEEPGFTTRTFLSHPMRNVHDDLSAWMSQAGMQVGVDAVGNLRGIYAGTSPDAPRLFIGSHLDTVPRAGAFDGVLGVVMGIALVDMLAMRRWPYSIEVIGFSEEEGVRFGLPFIGSRALVGSIDEAMLATRDANGTSVREAIAGFGLDPSRIGEARTTSPALGYLEFHIEQGPVLDMRGLAIAVVERIVGLSRAEVRFTGVSAHAGTTPMNVRRDALAGAAEWIQQRRTRRTRHAWARRDDREHRGRARGDQRHPRRVPRNARRSPCGGCDAFSGRRALSIPGRRDSHAPRPDA